VAFYRPDAISDTRTAVKVLKGTDLVHWLHCFWILKELSSLLHLCRLSLWIIVHSSNYSLLLARLHSVGGGDQTSNGCWRLSLSVTLAYAT